MYFSQTKRVKEELMAVDLLRKEKGARRWGLAFVYM